MKKISIKKWSYFWVMIGSFFIQIDSLNAQCPSTLSMSVQITQISSNAELVDFNGTLNDLTLEVAALAPGEIEMTVLVKDINYDGGPTQQWPHGLSFQAGPNWTAVAEIPPPGFEFFDSVTGICTGETYGPGYFYVNSTASSYNPNSLSCVEGLASSNPPADDGDPGNNWGIDPNNFPIDFGFNLTYCPASFAPQTFSETITFVITEDGQSGGWAKGSGCAPVTVTFTIDITNAYITCSCGEPSPDVILGSTPPTICAGNDFDLATLSYVDNSGLGATPVSYYATLPANSGNQISSVVNPETTTTYYVLLQESAAGCADIIEVTIPVTEPIAISAPTTACFNEPIILSSTNGIANWYDADPNAGGLIVHTGVSYSPTPTATGTYQYWATLEGGLCNIAATAVSVDVYGDPPIVSDVAYCFNETATPLTAIGNNNTTLLWWEESVEGTGSFIAPTPNTQIEGLFTYYVSQVENACVSEPAEINVIVNPYQAEIPYNGFDDDCNPLTLDDDLDQDGFTLADDCDDNNANINPNAVEIPDNMVDEDCNGEDLVLAIHEINELKVKVFPNPVSSTLEIIVPENVNYKIELFDVQGKLVQIYRNNNNIISVDNLPEGIYLLKLEELITKETVLKKVVVSK